MNKSAFYILFFLFSTIEVRADEAVVVEVRKNVSLSKNDKVYKNFFINGGTEMGLAKGSMVDVLRRLPVHDPLKNSSIGDIRVKVAQVEIIHADPKISVARLVSNESPENRPVVDFEAVMVGDRLDLASIQVAKPAKKEVAEVIPADAVQVAKVEDVKVSAVETVKPSRGPASVAPSKKKSSKKSAKKTKNLSKK